MTATPVAPLSASAQSMCPVCLRPATWQIGPKARSCTRCLGAVVAGLYAADPHPFQPYLPTPLRRANR